MPTADRRQRELMLIVRRIDCRHEVEPKPLNRRAHCAENHRTVALERTAVKGRTVYTPDGEVRYPPTRARQAREFLMQCDAAGRITD
jgi:hypothetical protein